MPMVRIFTWKFFLACASICLSLNDQFFMDFFFCSSTLACREFSALTGNGNFKPKVMIGKLHVFNFDSWNLLTKAFL